VIYLAPNSSAFEFVTVTVLRTRQLKAGCTARVAPRSNAICTAAAEVLAGKVVREAAVPSTVGGGIVSTFV
jgi:DNA-directed RNA polymerase subunit K/omega